MRFSNQKIFFFQIFFNSLTLKFFNDTNLGDLLMTMVAMKMEHAIKAPKDGVLKSVLFAANQVMTFFHEGRFQAKIEIIN